MYLCHQTSEWTKKVRLLRAGRHGLQDGRIPASKLLEDGWGTRRPSEPRASPRTSTCRGSKHTTPRHPTIRYMLQFAVAIRISTELLMPVLFLSKSVGQEASANHREKHNSFVDWDWSFLAPSLICWVLEDQYRRRLTPSDKRLHRSRQIGVRRIAAQAVSSSFSGCRQMVGNGQPLKAYPKTIFEGTETGESQKEMRSVILLSAEDLTFGKTTS